MSENFHGWYLDCKIRNIFKNSLFYRTRHRTEVERKKNLGGYSREFLRKHLQLVVSIIYRFFLQYQWMQFYIASLAIFYYFPYIMFQLINTDVISLSDSLKDGNLDTENFVRNFFNCKSIQKLQWEWKYLEIIWLK